ncbi:MAG: ion transporter [Verrucomicrobia bacterium]|nr:ion transporter [Verrucomicrobiota bacterium]
MTGLAKSLVESRPFRAFIIVVILLGGVLAGLETSAMLRARHGALLQTLDAVVIGIFVVEIVLKLVAHGRRPLAFFRDGWNVFDFLIVVFCLLPVGGPFAAVLRLARVLRLLRLVSALPKLQLLVGALLKSLSAMGYVSLLLALLFYIYAVAGVHWFGQADKQDFGTLPAALFTLFRIVTLDNWGDIFNRAIEHVPAFKVALYFVTFIVFGTMIILNLFIGIVLNSMSEMHAEMEERDRARHAAEGGAATVEDELKLLERQARELQEQLAAVRRRCARGGQPRENGQGDASH